MDWKKIKAEYIAGGTSYRKLADKYQITLSALRNVAEKEKWVELKTQAQHESDTKLVDAISTKNTKKATDIIDVADKLLDKIYEMLDADMPYNTQNVKNLTSALKDLKEIKGFKSPADMKEQEARIAKLQREAMAKETDSEIKVTIEGDLEIYSK